MLVWYMDREEENPTGSEDLLLIPLLIPYIIFLFCVSWVCLVDEFVLSWPFAYVKTERVEEGHVLTRQESSPVAPLTNEEQMVSMEEDVTKEPTIELV